MYRTLAELRDSINQLIEQQGGDAPVSAFIFTKEDVFEYNGETDEEDYFPLPFTSDVLADVGDSSYVYEQVSEMIGDAIRMRKVYQPAVSNDK